MVATTELGQQKCHSRKVLEQLVALLAPFAPYICEELWHRLGHTESVVNAPWPEFDESYLKEDTITMSVSFNGKTRFTIDVAADAPKEEVEKLALENENTARYLDGKQIVEVIVVPGRIVNIVIK